MEIPVRENPAATSVVYGDNLETMPRAIAAEEALRLVPGVKVASLGWQPLRGLRLDGAYTYSYFRYTAITTVLGTFKNTVMPNSPAHQLAANAQYVLKRRWVFGVGLDVISSWYVDQSNAVSTTGYVLLHLRAAYRWEAASYRGELFVYGRNMVGQKYVAFTEPDPDGNSYQPGPTREVFVGARFAFGE